MSLERYTKKRNFKKTSEPAGKVDRQRSGFSYLIQKHDASRLHYDFRLELDGVLKSWAVPKGPSLNPADKRLAVHVEDHPLAYGTFEGTIPEGEYGGGTVLLWDRGEWEPLDADPAAAYKKGALKFVLHGEKLHGAWGLIRMKPRDGERGDNWLLVKDRDASADEDADILTEQPDSVSTQRTLDEIADGAKPKAKAKAKSKPQSKATSRPRAGAKAALAKLAPADKKNPAKARKSNAPAALAPTELEGAKKKKMPEAVKPQLCTLAREVPQGDDWIHEIKFDGYRIVALVEDGKAELYTRNHNKSTAKYPAVAEACAALGHAVVLDGEVVVVRPDGSTDFQALQNLLRAGKKPPVAYYVFDILHCDGYDLTATPLLARKALLQELLATQPKDSVLRYSDHMEGQGGEVYANACKMSMEGVISKRADSPYVQKRSAYWVKVKCTKGQEFVIGGYTDPAGSRKEFGALLLGYFDAKGHFCYAGKVGTGFSDASLRSVGKRLASQAAKTSPFEEVPPEIERAGVHWLKPALVCEVEFTEWTGEGHLRHPAFKGLREDKPAKAVVREKAVPLASIRKAAKQEPKPPAPASGTTKSRKGEPTQVGGVIITHPDKLLYREGIRKLDLAEYYQAIAPRMLPHIAGRPIMLLRCPQGRQGKCFHQKHLTEGMPPHVRGVPIREKSGKQDYLVIDDEAGLVELANLGVLEFHTWGTCEDRIEDPDLMVFDLDPDPAVSRAALVQAVRLVHDRLESLGLKSFLKATGGKGFHVVVPLKAGHSWDLIKSFSNALADEIAEADPKHFIATMSLAKRKGKVFIDYLRNGRGATFIAPYSTRAKPNAPVAIPLAWEELDAKTDPAGWTIANVDAILKRADPWKDMKKTRQVIRAAAKKTYGL